MKAPKIFKLSDITKSLQNMILEHYNGYFWIQAEIAKLNFYPRTGHCFPDLVERERGKVKAELKSIIWSTQFQKINEKFKTIAKTELQEGMSVLLRGKLNYHPTYGFSIHIYAIDPKFTLGNMAKEKDDHIRRLKKEGLFDLNKQLQFPSLPKNIAIISYNTSKGYADFNQVMRQEAKEFSLNYQLFPSLLQGDGATKTLITQLQYIKNNWRKKFDVVLIIRGGGGDVGMNCYNDYELCKEIAEFPLPVVTGIGHSTNATIAELVAHKNTITPTQTAYFLLEKLLQQKEELNLFTLQLKDLSNIILNQENEILKEVQQKIYNQLRNKVEKQNSNLNNMQLLLDKSSLIFLSKNLHQVEDLKKIISTQAKSIFDKAQTTIELQQKNLLYFYKNYYLKREFELNLLANKVELNSPNQIFKRGYAVVMKNNQIEKEVKNFKSNDLITIKMYEGEIEASVTKTKVYES